MKLPSLKDIFYENDFLTDTTTELTEKEEAFESAVNKLAEDYNIPLSAVEDVRFCNTANHVTAQYTGFLQGFRWAVQLLIGKETV